MSGRYSDEFIERAGSIVEREGLTLEELSDRSKDLLGQHVGLPLLKQWSVRYKWLPQATRTDQPGVSEQISTVASVVYNQIIAESRSGLYLTGVPEVLDEVEIMLAEVEGLELRRLIQI